MSCQPSSVTTMVTGEGLRAGMPNSGNAFPMVTAAFPMGTAPTTHTHSGLLPIPSSPTRRVTAGAGDAVLDEPARLGRELEIGCAPKLRQAVDVSLRRKLRRIWRTFPVICTCFCCLSTSLSQDLVRSSPPHSPDSRPGWRAEHHLLCLLEREPRVQAGSPLTLRLPKSSRAGSLCSAQTDARTATVEMT